MIWNRTGSSLPAPVGQKMMNLIEIHEFRVQNDGFCIKNDEFCIINDRLCIKNDDFCIKHDELKAPLGHHSMTVPSTINALASLVPTSSRLVFAPIQACPVAKSIILKYRIYHFQIQNSSFWMQNSSFWIPVAVHSGVGPTEAVPQQSFFQSKNHHFWIENQSKIIIVFTHGRSVRARSSF